MVILWLDVTAQQDTVLTDPLRLNEIVITARVDKDKLLTPVSVYSLDGEDLMGLQGTAASLKGVPGHFVDASVGEVFSRVHTRGISLSAEDDIGWYYSSLYEDGLPVTVVQYNYYTPDFFFRPDLSVSKVESLRGGKSMILGANAPGGLIQFDTRRIDTVYQSHDRVTFGLYESGRWMGRLEGISGGPIGRSGWQHNFSYMFRYDEGPRNLDYSMNEGGQFKISISKVFSKGIFDFRIKYLNDKVNRYTGLAASGWDNPIPAFGQDFSSTSLLPPSLDARLPDGRSNSSTTYAYNPSNGIRAKDIALQANIDIALGSWILEGKARYSRKRIDWQNAIGGQPLGLENFLTYFISGDPFPVGLVEFKESATGQTLASVNNLGVLNAFQGMPPTFEYIQGKLPFDAVMGTGAWKRDDAINEYIQDLRLVREINDLHFEVGMFSSVSNVNLYTNASFLYTTYEPSPRLLEVNLVNPGEPSRALSDELGLSNYGALFYQGADIRASQNAIYSMVHAPLSSSTLLDAGVRLERIQHKGDRDRFANSTREGGIDGNPLTSYDGGVLEKTGSENIDFSYLTLSYSLGINHTISRSTSVYARYSSGNKAPEINYYTNNFVNVDLPGKGTIQDIEQMEGGVKFYHPRTSLAISGFYSKLNDVPFSEFVFDQDNNRIFYSPTLFNSSETVGLELESAFQVGSLFELQYRLTLQSGKLKDYQVYQTQGTTDENDDVIIDFSGNSLPHTPSYTQSARITLDQTKYSVDLDWHIMGARYGNLENSFKMQSYSTWDISWEYRFNNRFYFSFSVNNLFNSSGIANFFGPNQFGSNASQATAAFIESNPQASFVVFPIYPRTLYFSVGYRFVK